MIRRASTATASRRGLVIVVVCLALAVVVPAMASLHVALLASGTLLAAFSWQSIFALNALLSAVALAGTLRFVPESADPGAPRLDFGGAAIAVAALTALVFSVIEAPTYGWLATRTVIGLVL